MPVLVFDLETTNRQKGWAGDPSNRIVCASWVGAPGEYGYSEYGDEFEQRSLADRLDEIRHERGILVAHNAKFEAGWVKRMGFDPASFLWWDTLLCEYVMAGNRRWRLDLDSVAQRYDCGPKDPLVDRMMKNGVCPSQIPEGLLLARNRKDVHDTLHIFERQRETLGAELARVLFTRCLSVPVIADIETQGVAVDEAEVDKAIAETEAELRALRDEWATFQARHLSDAKPLPEWLAGKALSLTNSDHVAWIVYYGLGIEELRDKKGERRRNKATKRWPLGKPLANDKAIQLLALTTDAQRQFIRLRKDMARCTAALTKTLYFFKGVCQLHGGVFYGQFNQAVTQTHRLSSSGRPLTMPDGKLRGVQLQNMPRKYMKLLKAKAGMTASHDSAQLEFRAAVELGDDSAGRENIRLGVDQHKQTAAVLLQKPVTAVTDDERQRAKADTFKPLYGGRKGTPAQERYYAEFRRWFPGIAATQEGWTEEVLMTGELRLPWGMTFYWPGTKISRSGYIDNTASIYNYPIQSLATAEIMPVAVVYLYHRLRSALPSARIVNMVHDSTVADIPSHSAAHGSWLACGIQAYGADVYDYLRIVYNMEWKTPFGLGTKVGDAKEIKTELPIDTP